MKNVIILLSLLLSLILTIMFTRILIPILKRRKIGQKILEDGPSWHMSKEGTPTMGGLAFLISTLIVFLFVILTLTGTIEGEELCRLVSVTIFSLVSGLIGFIDDSAKVLKSKNKGLSARGKLLFQGINSIWFLAVMHIFGGNNTIVRLPFVNTEIELGIFYYVVAFLFLCGMVNAVNLTDGLDGLASTCILPVGVLFLAVYFTLCDKLYFGFIGVVLLGVSLGFLLFNLHPAKIFMGDTGSLLLGGIIAASAFLFDNPFVAIVYGFVFLLEAFSVILQVIYFKLTKGKRLFKMAPIHHHFEKCGYGEMKIVSIFGIASLIFCVIAYVVILL